MPGHNRLQFYLCSLSRVYGLKLFKVNVTSVLVKEIIEKEYNLHVNWLKKKRFLLSVSL